MRRRIFRTIAAVLVALPLLPAIAAQPAAPAHEARRSAAIPRLPDGRPDLKLKPPGDFVMEYSCEENNLDNLMSGAIKPWRPPEDDDE